MIQQAINRAWGSAGVVRTAMKHQMAGGERAKLAQTKQAQADEYHQARMEHKNLLIQKQKLALQQAEERMQAKGQQRKRMSIQRAIRNVPITIGGESTPFKLLPKKMQETVLKNLTPEERKAYIQDAKEAEAKK